MAPTYDDKKIIYTMRGVTRVRGTKTVLKDINLSYFYGAKIGVIGLNGSGKSTLMRILAGLDDEFTGGPPYRRGTPSAISSRNRSSKRGAPSRRSSPRGRRK
jgi:ATPase subunit of ABC transporter with duplicated ATPase domains